MLSKRLAIRQPNCWCFSHRFPSINKRVQSLTVSSRYNKCRPVVTIWQGSPITRVTKLRNSIRIRRRAPSLAGKSKPSQTFRFHHGLGGNHQVGPVRNQGIGRHTQGLNAVFELLDHVFLIAASVAFQNHLLCWGLSRNGVKNYSKGPCVTILE